MKKNNVFYQLLILFLTFAKVGLFTFGGGYAMIPIIQKEVSDRHKWINEEEIIDIIAISESTPGPIAVNMATYVGYKVRGIPGAILSTLGLMVPSFVIILGISFFYDEFIKIRALQAIFKGLKVGVIILLFSAVLKLRKGVKVNLTGTIIFASTLIISLVFSFLDTGFRYLSLILILLGLITGVVLTIIGSKKEKTK